MRRCAPVPYCHSNSTRSTADKPGGPLRPARAADYDVTFSEKLGLTSIMRSGVSEECGDLSRGTQEQLAVLTRLAFADMLLDKGEPVSLILDDPLVYSDNARLELMTDILASAAERMQVILLTCRNGRSNMWVEGA